MSHDQAKALLKAHKLTLTDFCHHIGKSTANLRVQAGRNGGQISELYRLAIIGFISEKSA